MTSKLLTTLFLIGWLFIAPSAATAHPLDELYQVTFFSIAPDAINLTVELYTGVLLAPKILAMIDTDQDELFSETEQRAYVNRFLDDLTLEIDGQLTPLAATEMAFPALLDLKAGLGVIRFQLRADLLPDHRGDHQFFYRNDHLPDDSIYMVNALSADPKWVQIHQQERDVFQSSLQVDYTISPDAPLDTPFDTPMEAGPASRLPEVEAAGGISGGQQQLMSYLYAPDISFLLVLTVLTISLILGGLHALTPGHGKTLVAAYLIGSRGTVKHAIFLGGVVTFTHTASVVVIGLLALLASQFILPEILVPVLEISSGLLVVYLGGQLLWARWRAYKNGSGGQPQAHHHHHHHPHDHSHNHEHHPDDQPHDHDHTHHHHHHIPERVRLADLLTLGISGGLVPCPEALGIMLIAVGLNRILLGLGMVVAFSFGLAIILIIIGVLLVRTKSLLDRMGRSGSRWQTLLPVISALIVTLLGLGIMLKGLMPYLAG